ncbi:S39A1 protein, partial [Alcedo cyanopectus]|nr:S39A1 protein [Ceyx cyanopectus]
MATGTGSDELAWSPGTSPRPQSGLEAKLGSLVLLLLLPLAFGLAPLFCFRRTPSSGFPAAPSSGFLPRAAGGGRALTPPPPSPPLFSPLLQLQFPLAEFILAMGFFLVLVLEQVALAQRDPPGIPEESRTLLPSGSIQTPSPQPSAPGTVPGTARGAIRSALLVLALALHSVLEGLALGLQEAGGAVLRVCLALVLHKSAVAFSLALKLLRCQLRPPAVASCLLLFCSMSPVGVALGTVVV